MNRMHAHITASTQKAFTIVELLIVIVVIAILAAISVVAYTGIQERARNTAIQTDLRNVASQIELYRAAEGNVPASLDQLLSLDLPTPSYGAYGRGNVTNNNGYNFGYCGSEEQNDFLLIAWNVNDQGFAYVNGRVQSIDYGPHQLATRCPQLGIASGTRSWFYNADNWRI